MASKGFVRVVVAVVGVLSLLGGTAQATIAYQVPAGTVGNQAFTGPLGMDFDVNSPIRVTELGVFDSAQDGLVNTITAYIYDRTTQTSIVSLPFTAASPGTLVAGSRMKALPAPIVLPAGFQGSIVAENFGASDQNGNSSTPAWTTDSGGGLVSFVGSARWGPTPGLYPPNADGGPANRYATGTLEFFSVNTLALGHISPITVPNPSFELPGRPDGGFGNNTTAWTPSAGNNAGDSTRQPWAFRSSSHCRMATTLPL